MAAQSVTHVAFLRAINVAGHAVVNMTDLRDAFAAAACGNVRSLIQSGNVVFESPANTGARDRGDEPRLVAHEP